MNTDLLESFSYRVATWPHRLTVASPILQNVLLRRCRDENDQDGNPPGPQSLHGMMEVEFASDRTPKYTDHYDYMRFPAINSTGWPKKSKAVTSRLGRMVSCASTRMGLGVLTCVVAIRSIEARSCGPGSHVHHVLPPRILRGISCTRTEEHQ
jgi:hypothetical protein